MGLAERNEWIAKYFEDIKREANEYLSRTYPDAPDPDIYMERIYNKAKQYLEEIEEIL